MEIPFMEETGDFLTLDTKSVAHASAAALVGKHYQRGKASFDEFAKCLEEGQDCKFYHSIEKKIWISFVKHRYHPQRI